MQIIGSIIARLGSKRLPYKNILPFEQSPMIGLAIEKLKQVPEITQIVVSTESELIARIASEYNVYILKRPVVLAGDNIPSIPVFHHIINNFPCDLHVNLNVNFPLCKPSVIQRAIELAQEHHEALSVPFAVWAQTFDRLKNYEDPWDIKAHQFHDDNTGSIDIHTEEDLLNSYLEKQGHLKGWEKGIVVPAIL